MRLLNNGVCVHSALSSLTFLLLDESESARVLMKLQDRFFFYILIIYAVKSGSVATGVPRTRKKLLTLRLKHSEQKRIESKGDQLRRVIDENPIFTRFLLSILIIYVCKNSTIIRKYYGTYSAKIFLIAQIKVGLQPIQISRKSIPVPHRTIICNLSMKVRHGLYKNGQLIPLNGVFSQKKYIKNILCICDKK